MASIQELQSLKNGYESDLGELNPGTDRVEMARLQGIIDDLSNQINDAYASQGQEAPKPYQDPETANEPPPAPAQKIDIPQALAGTSLTNYGEYDKGILDRIGFLQEQLRDLNPNEKSTISDLQNQIAALNNQLSYSESFALPKNFALQNANAAIFNKIDPNTGLPILKQSVIDDQIKKSGSYLTSNNSDIRDKITGAGWNSKSDAVQVLNGAAIFGLLPPSGGQAYRKVGGGSASNDDFIKVATNVGIDPAAYYSKKNVLDQKALYNAINDKTKDLYFVANVIGGPGTRNTEQPHAAIMFHSDGSGNLVPIVDDAGKPAVNYFDATRLSIVDQGMWAPFLSVLGAIFAPSLTGMLSEALSGMQVSAAVAPTAFTTGLPAVTLGQTLGMTAINAISNAAVNAGMSFITGQDPLKGMLSGAAGAVVSTNASEIIKGLGISSDTINKLADVANLSTSQVEKIISSGVQTGLVSAVTGSPNILQNVISNVSGQFVGAEAQNLAADALRNADPKVLVSAANAAGNVANIATQTAIKGGDINAAIQNAAPSIIAGAAQAASKVPSTSTSNTTAAQKQIFDAFGNPISQGVGTQYGDPTAALAGSQIGQTTLSDLPISQTSGGLPTIFPNGTVQINPNVQYGKIYDATVDGQTVQARDAIRSNGEKYTIYFDPTTGEHATTELTGNVNVSPTLGETKGSILESLTGGKVLDYGSLSSTYKFTLEGDPIVESPSGKFYSLKEDGTNKELNTDDLSKSLTPAGRSSNGLPILQSSDGKLYVGNPKTNTIEEAKVNTLFSFGTPPPEVASNISLAGTGSTSTINEDKFALVAKDFGSLEEKQKAIANIEAWQKQIQNDPKASADQKTQAADILKAAQNAVAPLTPQQQFDDLQNKASAAQAQVLDAANEYIKNPTVQNKAIADKAVLDAEIAIKMANSAKANITGGDLPQSTAGQTTTQSGAQQGSQTGTQQAGQATSTTTGAGTSNVPGSSTTTTSGLGGAGTGGISPTTSSSGITNGTDTGSLSNIAGTIGALTGLFGNVPTPTTGALTQIPAGYTAVTTPLAKRPIGDLHPISNIMLTPEEQASRASLERSLPMRRGGLASIR